MSKETKAYNWLTSVLTGWGLKESWAKLVAGAVIGACVAAGVLTLDGCTAHYSQSADGAIEYTGRICPVDAWQK